MGKPNQPEEKTTYLTDKGQKVKAEGGGEDAQDHEEGKGRTGEKAARANQDQKPRPFSHL